MSRETPYTIERAVSKRTSWPISQSSAVYYIVRYGCKKVVEVWARKGRVRKFYKDGKRVDFGYTHMTQKIEDAGLATLTIAFFLLRHAFDRQTAVDWCQAVADNLEFHRDYKTPFLKSELFAIILEAQRQAVPLPVAQDA